MGTVACRLLSVVAAGSFPPVVGQGVLVLLTVGGGGALLLLSTSHLEEIKMRQRPYTIQGGAATR